MSSCKRVDSELLVSCPGVDPKDASSGVTQRQEAVTVSQAGETSLMACIETIQTAASDIERSIQSGHPDVAFISEQLYTIERTVRTARHALRSVKKLP